MPSLADIFASMRGMEPEQTPDDARTQASILGRIAQTAFAPAQYAGDVARGTKQVYDPASGHVGDEAIGWGTSQAAGRLPVRYAAPMSAVQMARGAHAAPQPGYRLSENVDNRIPEGSPYFPSQRAQFLLNDRTYATSPDPLMRIHAAEEDPTWMADEIGGFNQPRITPGLSTNPRDVALRLEVEDALNGRDMYPAPPYTGWPQQR